MSLDELVELLSRFEVLADKRHARCWSPTRYADGATSRCNAGVEAVSALVFETAQPGERNDALNHAVWTLGRWVAASALEQGNVEDEWYAAAGRNGLVADDGERQTWATIRSLSAGLQEPIDTHSGN